MNGGLRLDLTWLILNEDLCREILSLTLLLAEVKALLVGRENVSEILCIYYTVILSCAVGIMAGRHYCVLYPLSQIYQTNHLFFSSDPKLSIILSIHDKKWNFALLHCIGL